nr:HAMP domain-containing histidine kinase [Desulfobulbaceae bacterium]
MNAKLFLPSSPSNEDSSVEFNSLLHLRWGAIICQILLVVLIDFSLDETIPYPIVITIVLFETVSNIFFQYLKRKKYSLPVWLFFSVLFTDIILLTILLFQTGGVMNPFSFLYLLHIVIGAILMPSLWSWGLTSFTNFCYSSLYFPFLNSLADHSSDSESIKTVCVDVLTSATDTQTKMDLHLKGMLVAFALTSFFIVYFIGKIRIALVDHNLTVLQLKEEKTKSEQLASLATLAAGTAHEISTPLSTIKLVTGELLQSIKNIDDTDEIREDLNLVRSQIEKCEEVLYQMSEGAGEHRGEQFQLFSTQELINEAISMMEPASTNTISVTNSSSSFQIYGPRQTFKRTLKGLLKNAMDAAPKLDSTIELKCWHDDNFLVFNVKDNGSGMNDETLLKATEPFYTTKPPGSGMGLGLFLAKSVVERFGGRLIIVSSPQKGTEVEISFSTRLISRC